MAKKSLHFVYNFVEITVETWATEAFLSILTETIIF